MSKNVTILKSAHPIAREGEMGQLLDIKGSVAFIQLDDVILVMEIVKADPLLTVAEFSQAVSNHHKIKAPHPATVRRWIKSGELRAHKVKGGGVGAPSYHIPQSEIARFVPPSVRRYNNDGQR